MTKAEDVVGLGTELPEVTEILVLHTRPERYSLAVNNVEIRSIVVGDWFRSWMWSSVSFSIHDMRRTLP